MHPIAHHVTMRLASERPLLLDTAQRRLAANVTLRLGQPLDLLFFIFADTHAHLLVMQPERKVASELARRIELSLGNRLNLGSFERSRPRPVNNTKHLRAALRYCLRQREHHGITTDAFLEASSAPDLLGLRENGAYTRHTLQAWLPRFPLEEVARHLPASLELPDELKYDQLADAAAAAVALPSLRSQTPAAMRAKRAAVDVASALPASKVSRLLGLHPATVHRLRGASCSPSLVRAVRLQLHMRQNAWGDQARASDHELDSTGDTRSRTRAA